MENVTEVTTPTFFSRRLTNDMREQILHNAYAHMDKELTNSVLMLEAFEAFKVVEDAYYAELYKMIPKEDFEVLQRYNMVAADYAELTISYDYKRTNKFKYCSDDLNGITLKMCPKLYTTYQQYGKVTPFRISKILSKVYEQLGLEFMDKFYKLFDNIACEDRNAKAAIRRVVYSATTTGKLVEAYPYMEKFIPEKCKTKENRGKGYATTSVVITDVDIASLLD